MKSILNLFKSRTSKEDGIFLSKLKNLLGKRIKNIEIYKKAFTHRSMANFDPNGNPISYERLEFLGDSILGSVISNYLYTKVPNRDEGYLTQMRSKIVSRKNLNQIGKILGLKKLVFAKIPDEQFPDTIYGDTFEALIGAIYLDRGFQAAEEFIINKVIVPFIDIENLENQISSYKSFIIEYCQKEKLSIDFLLDEDKKDSNDNLFTIKLEIGGKPVSKGKGNSKKLAEEQAAKRAYYSIQKML